MQLGWHASTALAALCQRRLGAALTRPTPTNAALLEHMKRTACRAAAVVLLTLVGAHEVYIQHRHAGPPSARPPPPLAPPTNASGTGRRLSSASCAFAATPVDAKVRVACVGDSLTRGDGSHEPRRPKGSGIAQRGNYPAILQKMLGVGFEVRNFGHGGATACNASDVPYMETTEWAEARRFRPDVIVLMIGTNDAKAQHWEGPHCGPAAYAAGMRALLEGQDVPRPFTLVLLPPPILTDRWGISQRLLPAVRAELRALLPPTAAVPMSRPAPVCDRGQATLRAEELPIQPSYDAFTKDGIHLNRAGSRQLACVAFGELVRRCGACASSIDVGWLEQNLKRQGCAGWEGR